MEEKISKISVGGLVIILIIVGYLIINGLGQIRESLRETPVKTSTTTLE